MPYLGRQPSIGRFAHLDDITSSFNSACTTFSLMQSSVALVPGAASNLIISLGGVLQEPEVAYTVAGSSIIFSSAPASTQPFFGILLGDVLDVGQVSQGAVINATSLTVGANVSMNTTTLLVGNSTVNTVMTATTLTVGANVSVNSTTAFVGNTTVNTAITSGGVTVNGNSPWLSQTFRGLTLRTHPDADVAASKVYLDHADEIVMHNGVRVADWDDLNAAITTSGAGGLDTGAEGASRWYEIHAIRKSSDGTKNLLLHRAKSYDVDQSNTSTDSELDLRGSAARTTLAQSIVAGKNGPMPFLDLRWVKQGSPTGQMWVTIEADSAGSPSGVALATSDKLDVSIFPTTTTPLRHIFRSPATLVSGTTYWIVARGNYTISAVNYLGWRSKSTSAYASGYLAQGDGSGVYSGVGGGTTYDGYFTCYVTQNDTALTLPSGYDQYAQVGWVYNNSSSNFNGFRAQDRKMWITGLTLVTAGTSTVFTLIDASAVFPPVPVALDEIFCQISGALSGTTTMSSTIDPSHAGYWQEQNDSTAVNNHTMSAEMSVEFQHLYYRTDRTAYLYAKGFTW